MTDLKPWVHRKTASILHKRYSPYELYYRLKDGLVDELCLGERYAHAAPGLLFENECYRGCYIDNWHGGPTGSLTDMIKWVSEAEFLTYVTATGLVVACSECKHSIMRKEPEE